MKILKFWHKEIRSLAAPQGRRYRLAIWGGSDVSQADAQQQARLRLDEIERRLQRGEELNRYSYGERPLHELVVQEVRGPGQAPVAVVTRNQYGALVLNAAGVMFMDIDAQEKGEGGGLLGGLFGRKPADPQALLLEKLQAWARSNPGWGARLYRTRAGWRVLVTHDLFDPRSDEARHILEHFGSDRLYIRLCRDQACFRARLTPKPWRCGFLPPPPGWPFANPQAEARFSRWQAEYESVSQRFGVCQLVQEVGRPDWHPEARAVLEAHDRLACAAGNLPLA